MLADITQFETEIHAKRQANSIIKALEKMVKFGRKYILNTKNVKQLKEARKSGETIASMNRRFRLSKKRFIDICISVYQSG